MIGQIYGIDKVSVLLGWILKGARYSGRLCPVWTNDTFILIYIVLINQSIIKNISCGAIYEVIIFFSIIILNKHTFFLG